MDLRDRNVRLGLLLMVVGVAALLGNLGLFTGLGGILGLILFGGASALVLSLYRRRSEQMWTLPVGFGLAGLALATLDAAWGGGAFLAGIGLGFVAVYVEQRSSWWALIPGGVLITLGIVAVVDETGRGADGGALFFLGLAATFGLLYLLPDVRQRWAIYPALAAVALAVVTLSTADGWILPIALIALGAYLLLRPRGDGRREDRASP